MRFLVSIGLLGFLGCQSEGPAEQVWSVQPGPKVLVSFPPLYSVAKAVAGADAEVKCLLTGSGVHSAPDPNRQQLMIARQADLFFYNGLGLDDEIVAKIKKPVGNKKWRIVELSRDLDKGQLLEGACNHDHGHADAKHDEHDHDHDHGMDPHVWLNPRFLSIYAETMANALSEKDPAHAAEYASRAKAFQTEMSKLQAEGRALLKDKTERKIISFHDSLRYFAKAFDFEIAGAIQIDAGVEPGPTKLKEIVDLCVSNKIRLIAVEPQFPRNTSAQAIKNALSTKGIEAEFVEINPLETGAEAELGATWFSEQMRKNLENLAKALK